MHIFKIQPLFGTQFVLKQPANAAEQAAAKNLCIDFRKFFSKPDYAWYALSFASPGSQNVKIEMDTFLTPRNQRRAIHARLIAPHQSPLQLQTATLETETQFVDFLESILPHIQTIINNGQPKIHFPGVRFDPPQKPQEKSRWTSSVGQAASQQYWQAENSAAAQNINSQISNSHTYPTPFYDNPDIAGARVDIHPAGEDLNKKNVRTGQNQALYTATITFPYLPNQAPVEITRRYALGGREVSDFFTNVYKIVAQRLVAMGVIDPSRLQVTMK